MCKILWSNCFFGIWYLILRGKAKKIVALESKSVFWPHHYVCINKKGNALHFQYVDSHENNKLAPWWFKGKFIGIRKSKIQNELKKSGRKIKFVFEKQNLYLAIFLLSFIFLILFVPWILFWAFYSPLWITYWAFHGLKN